MVHHVRSGEQTRSAIILFPAVSSTHAHAAVGVCVGGRVVHPPTRTLPWRALPLHQDLVLRLPCAQAFIGVTPRHPVMLRYLEYMLEYYQARGAVRTPRNVVRVTGCSEPVAAPVPPARRLFS